MEEDSRTWLQAAPSNLPASLLFSSLGDPKKGFPGYCASTPPDWSGERAKQWPGRHFEGCAPFRDGLLRPERFSDARGRGLVAGAPVSRGQAVCQAQPPLALHQYNDSKRLCEVCAHCGCFVGSLRSALARPLEEVGRGAEQVKLEDLVDDPADLQELEAEEWSLNPRLPCADGCGSVFCSPTCVAAAQTEGWHRALCTDLSTEKRPLWAIFKKHATRHHELFILAAQVIAEIVCLVRHHGADLWEAMAFFTRFAKMSWLSMLQLPSRSHTQGLPSKGPLAEMARKKRDQRLEVVTKAVELLVSMLWERRFAELLTVDFFSNLVGQFSLSNVWVQIEHPLSARLASKVIADPEFRRRFQRLAEASAQAAREAVDNSDEDYDGSATALETWRLRRYEGSGLYVCCALSNHSCRPNFTMRYANDMRATMVALRDISDGEELHLAYVSPSYDLSERLVTLWRHWGFVCTCQKCQDDLMTRVVERCKPVGGPGGGKEAGPLLSPAGAAAAAAVLAAGGLVTAPPSLATSAGCGSAESPPYTQARPALPQRATFQPAARLAAAAAAVRAASSAEDGAVEEADDSDADCSDADAEEGEEEEDSEEDEEESEDGFEGSASLAEQQYAGPLGPRGVPPSVLALQADLQRLMATMAEDGEMECIGGT